MIKKIQAVVKLLQNPITRFEYLNSKGFYKHISDFDFVNKAYKIHTGYDLNLENPITYTEKLQWLKIYDHRAIYTQMVDKYAVKKYVAEKIGEEYLIPLLGVWEKVEDINFNLLPNQFVLKTTHDSGSIIVCKDKSALNLRNTKKTLNKFLKRNYFILNREWPYKNVKHKIIAEKYMEDSTYKELRDYKFFTFNGVPKVLYVAQGRGFEGKTVADFFDMDYQHLPFTIDHDMAINPPEKPHNFELMKKLAAKLSEGTPQLRVDFYEVDGKVYFGEMTFFHCSGLELFHPEEWNKIFGEWVNLPSKII